MSGFDLHPLSELVEVFAGDGAPQDPEAFADSGNPFVRAASLPKLLAGASEDSLERIPEETGKKHRLRLFPPETVLFAKSGMSATKGHIYRLRGPAYVVNHLAALVPRDPGDGRFVERLLQFDSPSRLLQDAAYPSIRLPDIARMRVPIPSSKEERRRIADVMEQVESLRTKRLAALAHVAELDDAIFVDMFGDPVTNPKEWQTVQFGEVLTEPLRNGVSPSRRGSHEGRVLTLSAITGSRFDPSAWKEATFAKPIPSEQKVHESRFLICRGNGNLNLVGRGHFPTRSMSDIAYPDTIISGRVNDDRLGRSFVERLWNSSFVRRQLESMARTTSGIHKVNQTMLESVMILEPPRDLQEEYARRIQGLQSTRRQMVSAQGKSDNLLRSLRHRVFAGQV